MTLDEATKLFEGIYPVVEGNPTYLSQTGEEYTVVVSGGEKAEGEMLPCFASHPEAAVQLWLDAIQKYALGKKGTLYWRHRPELDEVKVISANDQGEPMRDFYTQTDQWAVKSQYVVYSRLLISDKEVIQ